jgi:hypothetical protein
MMMESTKNFRSATQGITAALLFGIAFAAGADQVMRAMPAPAATQPAVVAPAKLPGSNATMSPKNLSPTTSGGGVMQLSPAAACGMNTAPRITNINGTQSGIVFKPGDSLNIAGCGFGNGGQAYLSSGGTTVPLKIDTWSNENIHVHLINSLSGIPDLGNVKVTIQPSGGTVIGSTETYSFFARRETSTVTTNLSHYVKFVPGGANVQSTFFYPNGWGPAIMDQYGTVARVTTGIVETAFAEDGFTLLDPGKGFKTIKLNVIWLTKVVNNGVTDIYSGNVMRFRGENTSTPIGGGYRVSAGEEFIQNKDAPESPLICKDIRDCHYSKYQVSVDVSGPAGVTPP